jgi:hypothetical protein
LRLSLAVVVQRMSFPLEVIPTAPAGEQNAPA